MKLQLTITFIFLWIFTSNSQNFIKELKGSIMYYNKTIADVHIYNMTSKRGTSSTTNGEFVIRVQLNDTFLFRISNIYQEK